MAILVTGGTAKTSVRLGALLHDAGIPFLMAARRPDAVPSGLPKVKFDWSDESTWSAPFAHLFPNGGRISAAYLVIGGGADPITPVNKFVDYAFKEHGVKRFVLCAGGSAEPGGPMMGQIWQHFIDLGVEHCVLRPTWFMENFTEGWHFKELKTESKLRTATRDGKIPFVSAKDIAAIAFKVLTAPKIEETSYRVNGPELLSYDDVAEKLSKGLGRKIEHVKLSPEERKQNYIENGLPEPLAAFLTRLETHAAEGWEVQIFSDSVEKVTGSKGQTFDDFVAENKALWL